MNDLLNLVESVKQKLTDGEYKEMMESLANLNKVKPPNVGRLTLIDGSDIYLFTVIVDDDTTSFMNKRMTPGDISTMFNINRSVLDVILSYDQLDFIVDFCLNDEEIEY